MKRLLLVGAVALAGCGGSKTTTVTLERNTTIAAPSTTQRTSAPISDGRFDPQAIYEKDAAGVVTIISLYSDADAIQGQGAEGSGFVLNDQGEIATNAPW